MKCALLVICTLCAEFALTVAQEVCIGNEEHPCVCGLADNSGIIDLRSIKAETNGPWWVEVGDETQDNFYDYNPCYPFRVHYCPWCPDNLLLLHCPSDPEPCTTIGVSDTTKFGRDEKGLHIRYSYGMNGRNTSGRVYLICDTNVNTTFRPVGKASWEEQNIEFELKGPEMCVVYTTNNLSKGIIVGICVFIALCIYLAVGVYVKRRRERNNRQQAYLSDRSGHADDVTAIFHKSKETYGSCSDTQSDNNPVTDPMISD